jgi:toxin ParE1/3/4
VKSKPVIPREQARRDVDEALTFYLNEGSASAALGMIDALEKAYAHIARHPATGSPRYAHELNLPHLRV